MFAGNNYLSSKCDGSDSCYDINIHWSNVSTSTGTLVCSDHDACSHIEQPPTALPTSTPTYSPTESPSVSPSRAPTFPPTPSPTLIPTDAPTHCVSLSNISSDGEDLRYNIIPEISGTFESEYNVTNENVSYHENIGFSKQIQCEDEADICHVKCNKPASCAHSSIDVTNTDLSQVIIECVNEYSCFGAIINITNITADTILLICDAFIACTYMELTIVNSTADNVKVYCNGLDSCKSVHIISITNMYKMSLLCKSTDSCNSLIIDQHITEQGTMDIHCVDTESCDSMDIDLYSEYDRKYNASINCYAANSCHNLLLKASENVKIKISILRYSNNVNITYTKPKDIEFICGNEKDKLFIRYNVDKPGSETELIQLARDKFESNNMPCHGVHIDCTNYDNFLTKQCIMEYSVLLPTLHYISTISCYWLEICDIFSISCDGNCNGNIIYYQHDESFDFEIIIDVTNNTDSVLFEICDELFGTVAVTQETLHKINDIFMDVFIFFGGINPFTINDVLTYPYTTLRDKFIHCNAGSNQNYLNVIRINTDVTVQSGIGNKTEFDKSFDDNSLFVNKLEDLLSELFGILVILNTTFKNNSLPSPPNFNLTKDAITNSNDVILSSTAIAMVIGSIGFVLVVLVISGVLLLRRRTNTESNIQSSRDETEVAPLRQ